MCGTKVAQKLAKFSKNSLCGGEGPRIGRWVNKVDVCIPIRALNHKGYWIFRTVAQLNYKQL